MMGMMMGKETTNKSYMLKLIQKLAWHSWHWLMLCYVRLVNDAHDF